MLTMLLLLTAPIADDRTPKTNPLVEALAACLAIREDARRLACTDDAAAKLVAAEHAHDVVTVDRAEVHRARRSLFGLDASSAGDVLAAHLPAADRIDRLETTLAASAPVANGRWTLTLAEGGRWQTVEAWEPLAALHPGDAAVIHAGALGSYVLKLAGQRVVRVKRVG